MFYALLCSSCVHNWAFFFLCDWEDRRYERKVSISPHEICLHCYGILKFTSWFLMITQMRKDPVTSNFVCELNQNILFSSNKILEELRNLTKESSHLIELSRQANNSLSSLHSFGTKAKKKNVMNWKLFRYRRVIVRYAREWARNVSKKNCDTRTNCDDKFIYFACDTTSIMNLLIFCLPTFCSCILFRKGCFYFGI